VYPREFVRETTRSGKESEKFVRYSCSFATVACMMSVSAPDSGKAAKKGGERKMTCQLNAHWTSSNYNTGSQVFTTITCLTAHGWQECSNAGPTPPKMLITTTSSGYQIGIYVRREIQCMYALLHFLNCSHVRFPSVRVGSGSYLGPCSMLEVIAGSAPCKKTNHAADSVHKETKTFQDTIQTGLLRLG
jgi:hypothetical protein